MLTKAPGNGAPIGGFKVVTARGWFAARPSGTEDVYKIYAESFAGREHLERLQTEARELISRVFKAARGTPRLDCSRMVCEAASNAIETEVACLFLMRIWDPPLIRLTIASVIVGVLIGVVGGTFRWCLAQAELWRDHLVLWSHGNPWIGWIVPVVVALVAVGVARLLVVVLAPAAAGSGIHRVEAIMAGQIEPGDNMVLPVKFVGGLLSLGSGMALGREGPTVQMGATIGNMVAPLLVRDKAGQRIVLAAGSGAGLAVAFNAPIGGSVFVFEELTSSFSPLLLVAT